MHDGSRGRASRRLLARFDVEPKLAAEFDRSGLLEVRFRDAPAEATLVSLDGHRTVAWLAPSGEVQGLLVQDYVRGESRAIPFGFGVIEVVAEDDEIAVFLTGSASASDRPAR